MFNAVSGAKLNELGGSVPGPVFSSDDQIHKQIEDIIEDQFMNIPSDQLYQFNNPGAATHINLVNIPNSTTSYIIANNAKGKIDVIEKGKSSPYKQLNIDSMHCSLVTGQYLIIGSHSKLYLLDLAQDFQILSSLHVTRHIFSICASNAFTIICGQ